MVATVRHITFDCQDSYGLSKFWEQVTGFSEDPEDPNSPEHTHNLITGGDGGVGLLFISVPEPKSVKNRVHIDMGPDTTRDVEVERLRGVGASIVADHRDADGKYGFVVMADPEGNEFCIERSDGERAADRQAAG